MLRHHQESSYFLDSGHLEGGLESTLGEQDPGRLPARWEGSGLAVLGGLSPRSIFPYAWTFVRLSFIVGGPEDEMAYDKVWKRFCEFSSPRRAHVSVGSSIYLAPFPPQA